MYVCVGEFRGCIYLRRMCDRIILAREIQLNYWSTAGNLSNQSSGVQLPRDICTRFGRYLYSTKCSWIIKRDITCRQLSSLELISTVSINGLPMVRSFSHCLEYITFERAGKQISLS